MSFAVIFAALRDGGAIGLAAICMVAVGLLWLSEKRGREANAKVVEALNEAAKAREKEHAAEISALNKEHAAEIKALNEKRHEDVKNVTMALGDFSAGRAAIIDAIDRISDAIAALTATISELRSSHSKALFELRDKIIELWHRVVGRS